MERTILPLSGSALNELINNDYLSTDHVSKFKEILAKYTSFRPREVLLMWNLPDMVITPVEQNEKHIQILPSEASARVTHWICTYLHYDGTVIHVYDSLNCNQSFNISKDQFNFLHSLLPYNPKIIYEPVQQQKNRLDCGVYSIAFAVYIAFGLDRSKQTFEVALMRKHLQLIYIYKTENVCMSVGVSQASPPTDTILFLLPASFPFVLHYDTCSSHVCTAQLNDIVNNKR